MLKVHPRLGALKDPESKKDFPFKAILRKAIELPEFLDYETRLTPVKDQGYRGACVSFATAALKEYQEGKQRKFRYKFDFSEEWIYEQVRVPGGGAYPREAMHLLDHSGVPRETYMPYRSEIVDDQQEPQFSPPKTAVRNAKYYKAQTYARLTTIEDMMQSLVANGPFIIGVDWLRGWFKAHTLPTQINNYPVLEPGQGPNEGGHCILICGYDRINKVFKFKNSWGSDWANHGYAFFSFATIEQNLMDAWASFDINNPVINQAAVRRLQKEKDML